MPVVGDNSTISAEHNRYRRSRYQQQQQQQQQPISESDPNPPQIPSIIQSSRCKPTISSLLVSDGGGGGGGTAKKKNFPSGTFRGLGCTASSQVSVPAVIRTSANWEAKKVMKKQRSLQQKKNKTPNQSAANNNNPSSSSSSSATVVVPDVCCGPGFGFATATDAASVECAVPRRPFPGRVKVDGEKMNQRERPSCSTRRMVNPEPISFMDSDSEHFFGMSHSGFDVFEARYHRRVRHPSPEGLAEIMMLQSSLLMGGRSDGFDRYRDWRLDVDSMSYEELLELGDRIGYVNTGLKEDEIVHCLRETKLLDNSFSHFPAEMEWKCSICQEDYEPNDEMGKLECGHFYHIHCIKQWLSQKNACPICKTAAASQ